MSRSGILLFSIALVLLAVTLSVLAYVIYQYLPGDPKILNVSTGNPPNLTTANLSYEVEQFAPNMKFNHNSISYKINQDCKEEKRERMIEAFNELAGRVGFINFYEDNDGEIEVSCSQKAEHQIDKDYFIAGEGGAEEVIITERYHVITGGVILLYDNSKGIVCEWANIELHELLHVFGFMHSENKESLMYPLLESCDQKLDESIISDLKELYSRENLADLYFKEVVAVKKGIYLDFNVTVKNSGVINASNVILRVLENNKKLKDFELSEIPFGAGATFQVSSVRLNSRSSDELKMVIDPDNLIKEIDEDNNLAELGLN